MINDIQKIIFSDIEVGIPEQELQDDTVQDDTEESN